jgi:SAM-dependent methyltransferase
LINSNKLTIRRDKIMGKENGRVGINIENIKDAFLSSESNLYKKREKIIVTSHLNKMINNEKSLDQKLQRSRFISEKINTADKNILDFGSGLGFLSCYLAASGASEVTGVEVVESSITMAKFMAEDIFKVNNVKFINSIDQLEPEYYDVVLFNNVISHIDQPFDLLKRLSKLTKMNGLVYIEDNNNYQSRLIRKRNKKYWINFDLDYQVKRERFIETEFGMSISKEEISQLAKKTYGLDYDSAGWWINENIKNKKEISVLNLLRKRAPIDPDILIYHENSFTPNEVETILFNLGFIVLENHPKYVFDFKKSRFISFLFRTFPRLAFYVSPAYEIIGLKCRRYHDK